MMHQPFDDPPSHFEEWMRRVDAVIGTPVPESDVPRVVLTPDRIAALMELDDE